MSLIGQVKTRFFYPIAEFQSGRKITDKVRIMEQIRRLTSSERTARKLKQLHRVLSVAQAKVPYYRDLFKELRFKPDWVLDGADALRQLPFLDKDIIQEQGDRMLNEDFPRAALHDRKTGGSTGISTRIYYDNEALDWTAAVSRYAQTSTGRAPADLEVLLSSQTLLSGGFKERTRDQLKDLALNRVTLMTHSLSDSDLQALWDRLRRLSPFVLQAHPSTVYALALYVQKEKIDARGAIQVFESTGESLDPYKSQVIAKQLHCRIFNRYGTAEFGVTAESKEDPTQLEVIDYIVHHETVSLGNGLEELVATTTTNLAMPLIRYRTGDIAEIRSEPERTLIVNLQGRVHDLIEINGKPYPTHYMKSVLDNAGGVDEFQVLVKKDGTQILQVVLSNPDFLPGIEKAIHGLSGGALKVKAVKFDHLVRVGLRDKFRYVVRESK